MLAGDGRCKTFDAAANGFARGEGCGIVVLKRLSDAKRDGDRVLALIRGSAINQDGKSSGLTVPNGPAQESVIRDALTAAGLEGSDIDYVEAHGTGTSLGDPIEVRSLARVFGEGRDPDRPLVIGSVKTNIGHLEAAAGVAGFLKVVLALQHEAIPKHLNFKDPNPFIEWKNLPVAVARDAKPWPRGTRPRRAGVSSFGFSGTNAHLILEEAPADAVPVEGNNDRPLHCLTVSARSEASLHELARLYADTLAPEKGLKLADFAHVAATGRAHLTHRMAVVAADGAEAREALLAANSGAAEPRIRRGKLASGRSTEVVFLYTGAGAQYPGMARSLYQASPVFRDAIDHCDKLLGPDAKGRTLKSVFWEPTEGDPPIHDIGWTQPAMFAIEYALTTLWRSWGVIPAAVIGHSVGEYAAACAAGVFSVEDGLRLIAERGRLMQSLPPGGMMAALFAPIEEIEAAVAPMRDRVAIAAINGRRSVVISGETSAVEAVLADFAQHNVTGQRLFVSLAAHSPLMDPALDRMEALARSVVMSPPSIPIAWNLTGRPLPGGVAPDALYWRRHMREPVRFADGIKALHDDGFRIFLEVGPHPSLLAFAGESLPEQGNLFLTSLRRGKDDWTELLTSLADLHVNGVPVDFAGFDRPYFRRRVTIPTYAFDRQRYWAAPTPHLRPDAGEVPATVEGTVDAGELLYKVAWEPAANASAGPDTPSGLAGEATEALSYPAARLEKPRGWVVLGDGGGIGTALIDALESRGDKCVLQSTAEDGGIMDATAAQNVFWRKWRGEGGEMPCVIDLRWLDCAPETSGASLQTHVNGSLSLVKAMVAETGGRPARLWTVTRGAQAAGEVRNPLSPFAAAAWGLTWSAALEHPELCAVCVDLDPASVADEIAKLVFELDQDGREDKVVLRGGERLVARLRRQDHGASSNVLRPQELTSPLVRPDGQYVVTGGLSGLGLEVAEWLVEHGAKHISLIGRRGAATPGASAVLQRLAAAGVEASVASIDVGDADALGAFLSERRIAGPPLRGVIHAAGILDDAALASQDWSRFERVLRPKVAGAQNLDRLTRADPLDWFVMFSSAAVLLGAPGQANYAAANMILDVMAHERRRLELPALSINWGPWAQVGMAASMEERMLASGLTPFTPKEGLGAMETIMRMDVAQVGVLAADWMQFLKRRDQDVSPPPYFARVMASRGRTETSGPAEKPAVVLRESLPPDIALWEKDLRRATLDRVVRRVVAEVVGLKSPQSIDAALSLFKIGLDSLMAIQLQRRLERATEETLPAAFAFNYPTLEAMVELLDSRIAARVPAAGDLDTSMDLLSRVDELSAEEIELTAKPDGQGERAVTGSTEDQKENCFAGSFRNGWRSNGS